MNNTSIATSLDCTNELRQLILDNPDLPLITFVGYECVNEEYAYSFAEVTRVGIETVVLDGDTYVNIEDYKEGLEDKYDGEFNTREELTAHIDHLISEQEVLRAIIITIG